MRFSAVIFDFDGTLCDTGPGIMNSAAYALEAYGFEVPREPGALRCFIGPPLLVTFQEQFGADAATAQALVQKSESATTAPFSMRACFTGVL